MYWYFRIRNSSARVDNVLEYNIVESDSEIQLRYYVIFQSNTLGEIMNQQWVK